MPHKVDAKHGLDASPLIPGLKATKVDIRVLEQVVLLGIEIAREGREGRRIGTIMTLGDAQSVLKHSHCLILDPLLGHADKVKHISSSGLRETVKELAQLDGAFVISDEGVVLSACRFIDTSHAGVKVPLGLGTRHMAGASISKRTGCVAVVVSKSSWVRVFEAGEIVSEIIPDIWLISKFGTRIMGRYSEATSKDLRIFSKDS